MEDKSYSGNRCFNPLQLTHHKMVNVKGLQKVSRSIAEKFGIAEKYQNIIRLCTYCRLKVNKSHSLDNAIQSREVIEENVQPTCSVQSVQVESSGSNSNSNNEESGKSETECVDKATLTTLNETLTVIGVSPVKKKKIYQKKYPQTKLKQIETSLKEKVFHQCDTSSDSTNEPDNEILENLKTVFCLAQDRKTRIQILTVLPSLWSIRKIQSNFAATRHMISIAKDFNVRGLIMCTPESKKGHGLLVMTTKLVQKFYESEEFSRTMPGKRDFVTVREHGKKKQVQKQLVLCNLSELYRNFKDKHPGVKIGFSKFAKLRPQHCTSSRFLWYTYCCVCMLHQNVKLMIDSAKLPELTKSGELGLPIKSYQDCIARTICNPSQPSCYFDKCAECPGTLDLETQLQSVFDKALIDSISCKVGSYRQNNIRNPGKVYR
ncbi:hypothetical protein ANN_24772 [Periplaneta americana]|uniref:Uncharacterized protein n=1 Tax=Periplaneta americana TaxID=6978 RepID=A0ABQ8RZN8_PERAM|nr:hypothetical protein ANN_24772 [Periplaneta americana]